MRRVKWLIDRIRALSENEGTVSDSAGISDEDVLQYINEAQRVLFGKLEVANNNPFVAEDFITTVANQEEYSLPPRTYLKNNIVSVEYSHTGDTNDFSRLRRMGFTERDTSNLAIHPRKYLIRNGSILLNPIPTTAVTNGVRVQYVVDPPRVDKRRAQLDSVTVSSGQVTALSVDITDYTDYFSGASDFSDTSILVDDYFCVVGADGTIKARNIPITAISTSNGDATITSYTPESTSETAATGDYLVAGTNSTSHSILPTHMERYLIEFSVWRMLRRDSSVEAAESAPELVVILEEMLKSWQDIDDDVKYPAILNTRYLYI